MNFFTLICCALASARFALALMQRLVWRNRSTVSAKRLFPLTALAAAPRLRAPACVLPVSLAGFGQHCLHTGFPLLFLCGIFTLDTYATEPPIHLDQMYSVTSWSVEDGLPDNSVNAMVQTPDG